MLKFTLCGSLGCARSIEGELTLAIASPIEPANVAPRVAWVLCIIRDHDLRAAILPDLQVGEYLRVQGFIEPLQRKVGGQVFRSVAFVAMTVKRLPAILPD